MSEADVIRNPPQQLKSVALSMGVELDDPRVQRELARLVALKRREEKQAKAAARSRRAAERAGGSKGAGGSDAQLPAGLSYVDGDADGGGSDADDEDDAADRDDADGDGGDLDLVDVDGVGGKVRQTPSAPASSSAPVPRTVRGKPRAKPRADSPSASDDSDEQDDDDDEEEETVDLSHVAAGSSALRQRKPDVYTTSTTGSVARVVAGAAAVAAAAKSDAAANANIDDVDDDGRPFDTMETLQAMIAGVDKMSTGERACVRANSRWCLAPPAAGVASHAHARSAPSCLQMS